jgi:hypothetical protein
MNEGKNILKIDGPISNKTFLKNALVIFGYAFFSAAVLGLLHLVFEVTRYNLLFFATFWIILILLLIYTSWLNFTKRIWDILGDKTNAIFYSGALLIANIAMSFIPVLCYIGLGLSFTVACILIFKKGKLVNTETKNNNDVA